MSRVPRESKTEERAKSTTRVLRQGQVADLLGVPVIVIRDLADKMKIPFGRTPGGQRRYSRADALAAGKLARKVHALRELQRARAVA